ncbi:QueT transporter family protein [Acholeplasma hippikon]|uniref:Predicted membrane protein n=1 Tax=Acholeplasma hippikon TaxID=264636 RepID=A0A449BIV3_9MOLU|nr:QueT transporter family protein [Acholeplasma hippikon]VEU82389.1 Predicted membrane protein [Acholeplasma hippikon]
MNNKFTVKDLAVQAMIASIYTVLVLLLPWISFSASLQVRIAEALLILVFFNKKNAIGIIVGTFVANLNSPYGISDAIFGTVATTLVCVSFILLGKRNWLISLLIFPALFNGIIVAGIDAFMTSTWQNFVVFGFYVAFGELLVVTVLGIPLKLLFEKNQLLNELVK